MATKQLQVAGIVQECTSNCPDPTDGEDSGGEDDAHHRRSIDGSNHSSYLEKRDDGYVRSQNAANEMIFVSMPDQRKNAGYRDFVYDKSAGSGVTLYIVDTGAELSNDAVRICKFPFTGSSVDVFSGIWEDCKPERTVDTCKRFTWW